MLAELCALHGSERVVFSLDLKAGKCLGPIDSWGTAEPAEIAAIAVSAGIKRLLVLDLAHVGTGAGSGTAPLCRHLTTAFPKLQLAAGGGIGSKKDLQSLADAGVQTVLIASALHDGRLTQWRGVRDEGTG